MRFIRLKEVMSLTGLGRSSIYKFMSEGQFPQSISLGERAVAWEEREIKEWLQDKFDSRNINFASTTNAPNKSVSEEDVVNFIKEKFSRQSMIEAVSWVIELINN